MEAIINTVSTIFKERYGAELKIERNSGGQHKKPYFLSHWQSHFVYSRTLRQVTFPIFNSKRELQAIATASPVDNQDAIIFDEMAQFLQLTVAEHIELSGIIEQQIQTEMAIESAHVDHSKVVQLKTRKPNNVTHFEYKKQKPSKEADLRPIWISGDSGDFNSQIAFSIHDWVSNWAFLNAKEIPDLVWQDPNSWQTFPQVTIFVPNVSTLSENKIERLKDNLKHIKAMKEKQPLIIVTSPMEVSSELESLKSQFKHYNATDKITARMQAHFLLYHHKENSPWIHQNEDSKSLFFLPFSPGPKSFH